ncbi:MAG: hypothetical protein LQ351_007422 [Letrouitia transgressa]|nr:MAG: hypothetical protein LQ351_007422 [Letrouitia transgressa]
MSTSDVFQLVGQLNAVIKDLPNDEAARKALLEATRKAALALESPGDTIQRIAYLPLQLTIARVANDVDLFETIVHHGIATTKQIAKEKCVDEVLLDLQGRLLRFMASHQMVAEVKENTWAASNITRALVTPGLKGGINHNFDTVMPCYQQMPKFLRDTKFQNPTDSFHGPFQRAHETDQLAFVWLHEHPSNLDFFVKWMGAQHEGQPTWLDVFPFEKELCNNNLGPETPLFVDIGGGAGHQCHALKARHPHAPGRVILQDLSQTISQAVPTEGIETMAYDFWTPQPIKDARAYYMRNILHDYPDDQCVKILGNTKTAMGTGSVILIDDMVLPSTGAHYHAATLDMMVMSALAAMERSEKQWQNLLDAAGLKIRNIYVYTEDFRDSIIVAVPK